MSVFFNVVRVTELWDELRRVDIFCIFKLQIPQAVRELRGCYANSARLLTLGCVATARQPSAANRNPVQEPDKNPFPPPAPACSWSRARQGVLKNGSVSGKHDGQAAATASFSLPAHAGLCFRLSSARRLTQASPLPLKLMTLAWPRNTCPNRYTV